MVDLAAAGRGVVDVHGQTRVGAQVGRGDHPLVADSAADQHLVGAQRRSPRGTRASGSTSVTPRQVRTAAAEATDSRHFLLRGCAW